MQRIGIHLTDRCQLDCAHCLRDPALKPRDLPVDALESVLEQASRFYGIRHVSLTGGEPSLHPSFAAVLDCIAEHGYAWDMVTNGRSFVVRVLEKLLERESRRQSLRRLTFSLDGSEEATHDAIRGTGSYRDVISAAGVCAVSAIPFALQMTVHAVNVDEIDSFALLGARLGADHVAFAMMQPTGTPHDLRLRLPAQGWEKAREKIAHVASILRIGVVLQEGWPEEGAARTCGPMRGETLHVDVDGRLTLCCLHAGIPGEGDAEVAGDVRHGLIDAHVRLLEIIREAQARRLRAIESDIDSPWRRFGCNGCLARAGKPHWSEDGVDGPSARRERWRGAWSKVGRPFLPVLG